MFFSFLMKTSHSNRTWFCCSSSEANRPRLSAKPEGPSRDITCPNSCFTSSRLSQSGPAAVSGHQNMASEWPSRSRLSRPFLPILFLEEEEAFSGTRGFVRVRTSSLKFVMSEISKNAMGWPHLTCHSQRPMQGQTTRVSPCLLELTI